jgi:hypothetical protein
MTHLDIRRERFQRAVSEMVRRRRAAAALHISWFAESRMLPPRRSGMQRQRNRRMVRAIVARGRALHPRGGSGAARPQCDGAGRNGSQASVTSMKTFVLLVTWIVSNQPPSSYQTTFNSAEACEAARNAILADG